jgi:hypothetical protein
MSSLPFNRQLVLQLQQVDHQFLQVLVHRFSIKRNGSGFELSTAFDKTSDAITSRKAKHHVRSLLPQARRTELQAEIDAYFDSQDDTYTYDDSSFPFRLGNGGTLPVVRMRNREYYCLFFRDTHPVGWNIANGGADNRHDLLHPDAIIERELREELIVVDPTRNRRYVFEWHDAHLREHPDFAVANARWATRFQEQGFSAFENVELPLRWLIPPDAKLDADSRRHWDAMRIRYDTNPPVYTGRGFLNINAEDFGIEFDRIAELSVSGDAVFCDGELRESKLLNRPVGLFPVDRMQVQAQEGRRFIPERLYWNGLDRSHDSAEAVVREFLDECGSNWDELERNTEQVPPHVFDLCPAARTIVRRHSRFLSGGRVHASTKRDVFLSFASEDRDLARRVHDYISNHMGYNVFFSDVSMLAGRIDDQIDSALESAWGFVAVSTQPDYFEKSWVRHERQHFHMGIRDERKHRESPFFAFTSVDPARLPSPLHMYQALRFDPGDLDAALSRLPDFLVKPPSL